MVAVALFPGILDALRALRRTGCRLGVLSSNARENILTCLRACGGEGLFEAVVGYPTLFGKARRLRRLLRTLGVDRHEAVYVGDEVRDIEAGRRAGVQVAAVTWGFNTRELLASHRPDFLVDRPEQLPNSLARRP
jgi:phosphoglycolate phosphatase